MPVEDFLYVSKKRRSGKANKDYDLPEWKVVWTKKVKYFIGGGGGGDTFL